MNKLLNAILAVCLVGAVAFNANAADAAIKVGYVQVDKILKEAPQTSATGKKLEKEFSPRTADLNRLKNQIQAIEKKLNKEALTLSDSARRAKERESSNLKIEYQRKQRELREDINLRKNEELGALQERINKAVSAVAEADGYDLVIYGGVAFASEKIDITNTVLKSLGKK